MTTQRFDRPITIVLLAGHVGKTVRATLPPQSYVQVMKTGIPLHQELDLKPGTYTLRLGVIDRGSQRIGTVDVPVTIQNDSLPEMPAVTDNPLTLSH